MSKIKLLKGLASLFKKKGSKKTEMFGPARDPEVDYETAAALKESRKLYDLERKNLSPLQKELDDMLEASNKRLDDQTNELKVMLSDMDEMTKQLDEFNRIADEEGVDEAISQLNRILNPKRTLNADGGRVGKFKGGLMQLLKRINPQFEASMAKPKVPVGPQRPDAIGDMEQIKNIIRDPATGYDEVLKLEDMIQNSPRYTDDQRRLFFRLIDKEKARVYVTENATAKQLRMIENDPEGFEVLLEQMVKDGFGESFNQGGRVGMFAGGKLIGKGIMEAAKLAKRGMKPFGEKQTYKQKVTMKGVSDDQFDEIFEKQLARVPDEVSDQATADGLNQSLREAEAIITGQKLGLLSQPQRTKIATAITKKVRDQIYGDNARFSNDYLEYMDDAVARVEDILQIERLGGNITPKPMFDGSEIIGAQVDFGQLPKLLKKQMGKTDSFQKLMKQEFDKELYLINKVKGPRGNPETELFDLYEEIASGARYDMIPKETRSKMLSQIDDSLKAMEVDGADYQNFRSYLQDEYGFANETAFKDPVSNVIPFKPKTKKANGGTVPPLKGPASDGMGSLFRRK